MRTCSILLARRKRNFEQAAAAMEDTYTHSSFTLLQTTELIREVVDHVLRQSGPEVPQELRSDLASWRDGQRGEGGRQRGMKEENSSSESVEDVTSNIPFDLVKRAHKQLAKTPLERGPVYLHELLNGSRLVLPGLLPPPRDPQLVKRLDKIRREQEQKEYDRMVKNVDNTKEQLRQVTLGLEVQATSRQLWMVLNFLFTVIGAFVFGFFAGNVAGFELPGSVFIGLFMAILVFIADLYFLVRNPMPPTKPKIIGSKGRSTDLKPKQQ